MICRFSLVLSIWLMFCQHVYIEYGRAWRLGQSDIIHSEFLFVEQMCSFLQNQSLTKWSLVEKIHEIFWISNLAIELYGNSWCIFKFLSQTCSKSLSEKFRLLVIKFFEHYLHLESMYWYIHISSISLSCWTMIDHLYQYDICFEVWSNFHNHHIFFHQHIVFL